MHVIKFQLPDNGLREISGEMYLEDEFLVFVVIDALMGEFDKEQQIIKIEPHALAEFRLIKGLIRDKIYIRPKKRTLLSVMPGKYGTALYLKVWNKHRKHAMALVEAVRDRMEQQHVRE